MRSCVLYIGKCEAVGCAWIGYVLVERTSFTVNPARATWNPTNFTRSSQNNKVDYSYFPPRAAGRIDMSTDEFDLLTLF